MLAKKKSIVKFAVLINVILFSYFVLELFSFIAYSIISKGFFSFSRIRAKQRSYFQSKGFDGVEPITEGGLEVIHPYIGFVYSPEKNTISLTEDHGGLPISKYGFIDDKEPVFNKADNKVVIGIFGGSLAYYFSVHGIDSFVKELRESYDFSDKEILVVRIALGGYKQPQQLIALTYLLTLGAHFDIVINIDGFNDITLPIVENIPKGVFPFYPRNWFMLTTDLQDISTKVLVGEIAYLRNKRKEWARLFINAPLHWSVVLNIIWEYYDKRLFAIINSKELALLKNKSNGNRYVTTGPPFAYNNEEDFHKSLVYVWKTSSLQMHKLCVANNIKYYHFLQPNQYVPNSKKLSEGELKQSYSISSPYKVAVEQGYPYLIKTGEELVKEGVDFYDLTMIFREHGESLYSDNMCHLNKYGYNIMGTTIGEIVAQKINY